jgi:hypothetical protein
MSSFLLHIFLIIYKLDRVWKEQGSTDDHSSILGFPEIFLCLTAPRSALGLTQPLKPRAPGPLSQELKRPEREADY